MHKGHLITCFYHERRIIKILSCSLLVTDMKKPSILLTAISRERGCRKFLNMLRTQVKHIIFVSKRYWYFIFVI